MINHKLVKCYHNAERYIKFINSRIELNKTRDFTLIKFEKHHIIPVGVGGTNDRSNIIRLSVREHYIAHLILYEVYQNSATANAVFIMSGRSKCNSRLYEQNRLRYIESVSGKNHPGYGRKHSEETKQKIAASNTGKKHSQEYKDMMSIKFSGKNHPGYGKPLSDEHKMSLSKSLKGLKKSEETKRKMSESKKGKKMAQPGYWAGKKLSQEHIDKCVASRKGYTHDKNTKNKISESHKKTYSINGNIYKGRDHAAEALDMKPDAIKYRCLSKNIKWKDWFIIE